jgi:hypothetical protein
VARTITNVTAAPIPAADDSLRDTPDDLGDVDVTAFYNRHYGDCRYDY